MGYQVPGQSPPTANKKKIYGIVSALAGLIVFGGIMAHDDHEKHTSAEPVQTVSREAPQPQFVLEKATNEWRDFICTRSGTQYAEWPKAKAFQLATRGTKTLWGVFTPEMQDKPHKLVTDSAANEKCGFMNK